MKIVLRTAILAMVFSGVAVVGAVRALGVTVIATWAVPVEPPTSTP